MSNPKFYDRATDTGEVSEDKKPIYRLATYFTLQVDANNTVDREAREADKENYPAEFAAYERTRQPDAEGFPLAAWTGVDAAERQGLADRGIFTVEKLAATNMSKAPAEMRDAQKRAQTFLDQTSQDGPKLAARIAELEGENEGLKDQIVDMQSAIEALKSDSEAEKLQKVIGDLERKVSGLEAAKQKVEGALQGANNRVAELTTDVAKAGKK